MKAVFIRRYGGPEVLEYGEFPDPVVGVQVGPDVVGFSIGDKVLAWAIPCAC
jgi:hypothetical protein